MNPTRASTLGGFVAIALWSSTIAFARSLSEALGSLTAGASVYLIAGLFFLLTVPARTRSAQSDRPGRVYLWGCGSLFVLYTVLLYLAVGSARDREQVLEIGLVNYLWPALTILLSLPLLGYQAGIGLLPGALLATSGIGLVMTQGARLSWGGFMEHLHRNPMAYIMAASAAIVWALYSNLARRWSKGSTQGAVGRFVIATGVVLLLARWMAAESTTWNYRSLGEAVFLGGVTALAYALWERAMRTGHMLLVAVASYFTPLLSTLVSCAYLRVSVSPRLWLGCALLIAGSLLSWRSVSARELRS